MINDKKMKPFFNKDIVKEALKNNFFRRVLETRSNAQVVVMSIKAGENIGLETHDKYDQILINVKGNGICILNGKKMKFKKNNLVYVPKGTKHDFINKGKAALKIITIYSPPNHPPKTIHKTKAEADLHEKD